MSVDSLGAPPEWLETLIRAILQDSVVGGQGYRILAGELEPNKFWASVEPEGDDTLHIHVVPAIRHLGSKAEVCCDVRSVMLAGIIEGRSVGIQIYYEQPDEYDEPEELVN